MSKSISILLIPLLVSCSDDRRAGPDACAPGDCPCAGDCAPQAMTQRGLATSVLLPDGRLAIVTYDDSESALVVVFQRPGQSEQTYRVVTRHPSREVARWARIARESSESSPGTAKLQVAWSEPHPAGGLLRWSRGDEGGFSQPETISQSAASHVVLRIGASDRAHVAFRDDRLRTVRYATRQGGGWLVTGIQGCAGEADCPGDGEDFGGGLDLALVPAGGGVLPRIAFYDARRGDLKLAGSDAAGRWTTVTLDGSANGVDSGDVGRFVSLAVTPTRSLGTAYFDATLGVLRYIGPSGSSRVVDSGVERLADGRARRSIVGQYCALDFDSQGSAHILYADTSTPGLRHAKVSGEGAAIVTPLAIPPGFAPSFEVASGRLVGVYASFIAGSAPETSPRLFDLSADAAAGAGQ